MEDIMVYTGKKIRVVFDYYRCNSNVVRLKKGRPTEDDLWTYRRSNSCWMPSARGGKTVAKFLDGDKVLAIGEALCSFSDNFNYKKGRELAFDRAIQNLRSTHEDIVILTYN